MQQVLEIKNVYKAYSGRTVVEDASFFVQSGEIVGLIGPNGAGKTTCFYMACGLVKADKGQVFINQHDISKMPMHKRAQMGIGYLPQEPSIFRKLSVEDNIMALLENNNKLNKKQRKHRLEELLAEFHIEHIRHNEGLSLSGGERRRVEIARSLALDPSFILLDEPFAGVDPISVADIQEIIRHLRDKNIGVLITDHNYREMLDTCDHSYVLNAGKIIAKGDKEQILSNRLVKTVYLGERRIGS
ncbi:MAG TPA: LPS export ABC transporter ATP-binding protein [Candidatus Thioglobus sp.]|jgi:ABC-type (unclassified) transport system, ATPase component|nr:LPS export ABC transporter ATP-binding protein [Candidatus Thioglobus sp.]